ncbi:PRG4 [Branchiostoma lanceolatum]|uniref:PRG4 protein n=1 Tax=Branchiostoma lanceolatum TaxID=7740 RepID=A0A8J9ZTY7_BRALA|nr:PRG4 [Branchiostoma lanceolatum]
MTGTGASPLWLLVLSAIVVLHAEDASSTSGEFHHADTSPLVPEPGGTVEAPRQVSNSNLTDPDVGRSRQRRRGFPPRLKPSLVGRLPLRRPHPETTPRSQLPHPGTKQFGLQNGTIAGTPPVPARTSLLVDADSEVLSAGTATEPTPIAMGTTAEPLATGEFAGCGELESCAGRCGEWNSTFNCQCDSSCREFDDCCQDYHTECGTTSNVTGGDLASLKVIMADSCRWRCQDDSPALDWTCSCIAGCVRAGNCCADHHLFCTQRDTREEEDLDDWQPLQCIGTPGFHDYYWMVATCPAAVQDAAERNMCEGSSDPDEDPLLHLPVFDPTTGTSYRNLFCAHCNNATTKLSWAGIVRCSMGGSIRRMVTRPVSNPFCDWELVPRVMERSCVPRSIDDSLSSKCDRERCLSYTANVYRNGPTGVKKYRNIDCARCASDSSWPNVTCSRDAALQLDPGHARARSLRILFDFSEMNTTKTQLNGMAGSKSCPIGKVFDPFRLYCRSVIDNESFRYKNFSGARIANANSRFGPPSKGNRQSADNKASTQGSGIFILPSRTDPNELGRNPSEESPTYATWPTVQPVPTTMLTPSGRGTVLIVVNSSSMLLLLAFACIHFLVGKSRRSAGSVLRLHLVLALLLFHGSQTAGQVLDSSGGPWKVVVACSLLFCLVSKLTASMKFGSACQYTKCQSTSPSTATTCGFLVLVWAVSGVVSLTALILYDPQPHCVGSSRGPFDGVVSCSTAPYATVTSYGGLLLLSTAADLFFFTSAICRSRLKTLCSKFSKREMIEAFSVSALLAVVFTANLVISAFSLQTMSYVVSLASSLLGSLVTAVCICSMETKQSHKEILDGCSQDGNPTPLGSAISLVSFRQIQQ